MAYRSIQAALWLVAAVIFCLPNASAQESEDLCQIVGTDFDTLTAEAFIEYDSSRIVIESSGKATFHRKTRIRIFREAGLPYSDLSLFENVFVKVSDFEGRVVAADGKEILKRARRDLAKSCGFGASFELYSDICFYQTTLRAGNYPITVEYAYKQTIQSLFAWPAWLPQRKIPVLRSYYAVDAPADFAYRVNVKGQIGPLHEESDGKGKRRTTIWQAECIPPFRDEAFAPPAFERSLSVDFAPGFTKLDRYAIDGSSWQTLAKSFYEVVHKKNLLDTEMKREADRLVTSGTSTQPRVDDLHRFLMARQRYVAVSIGIGGWQPHDAITTYRNRYGDCKDLSTLYVSMLNHAGIEAHLALVRTKDEGQIDPSFPTLGNFNHAIVMYRSGDDTVWVDPTCTICALGDLPKSVEGIYALVIDPVNPALVRTPASSSADNGIAREVSFSLSENLSASITCRVRAYGNSSHDLKYAALNLTSEEFAEYCRRRGLVPQSLKIESCRFDRADSALSQFEFEMIGSLNRAALKIDDRVHLNLQSVPSLLPTLRPDSAKRTLPLQHSYPLVVDDKIVVVYPEHWQIADLPAPDSLSSAFGSVKVSHSVQGDTLIISRRQERGTTRVEPPSFAEYTDYQSECARILGRTTVLQRR